MFKTLDDIDCRGRRVLVRGDLNVPLRDGAVSDTTRLDRLVPTLAELSEKGAKVVVLSHFGRPNGRSVPDMSLRPIADALSSALGGQPVAFTGDCIGERTLSAIDALSEGAVLLLENLRFHAGEEANDPGFADALAANGDLFVNDGFSVSHRTHASTSGVASRLPAFAGRGMQAELEALASALETPRKPVAALVGGAKVSTKLTVLGHLIYRVDSLIIGGGMANTFLFALGTGIGASLCEKNLADTAREILARADETGCRIVLPQDAVIAAALEEGVATETVPIAAVPDNQMILDVGPSSVAALNTHLAECGTLLWNGPLGAFEIAPFDAGTNAVARRAAELTASGDLISVAGGGDTVAALSHADSIDCFSYVSTAGGAFLEWLEGKELPGVVALER
ncbi:MAG: Phosphoglycerate kinase [Alphaproteobacteria bacterium MarineAlpha4_Bin2]|nr:MAG: Phosphoglycerate kinase [Alphaproteobacteria bacterium MarineAlpha4_Bin2]